MLAIPCTFCVACVCVCVYAHTHTYAHAHAHAHANAHAHAHTHRPVAQRPSTPGIFPPNFFSRASSRSSPPSPASSCDTPSSRGESNKPFPPLKDSVFSCSALFQKKFRLASLSGAFGTSLYSGEAGVPSTDSPPPTSPPPPAPSFF
jgi:hypothetical protein